MKLLIVFIIKNSCKSKKNKETKLCLGYLVFLIKTERFESDDNSWKYELSEFTVNIFKLWHLSISWIFKLKYAYYTLFKGLLGHN